MTLRRKHWIELDGRFVIGEGGAELLQAVDRRGSLAEGARQVGWSYRHAWGYVRRAEAALGVSLVSTKAGKGSARGTVITDAARNIIVTLLRDRLGSRLKMEVCPAAEPTGDVTMAELPIACTLTPEGLQTRRESLLMDLVRRAERREVLADGLRLQFAPSADSIASIARVVEAERHCCRFLRFSMTVESDGGPVFLELTGPAGTRDFLSGLFEE